MPNPMNKKPQVAWQKSATLLRAVQEHCASVEATALSFLPYMNFQASKHIIAMWSNGSFPAQNCVFRLKRISRKEVQI